MTRISVHSIKIIHSLALMALALFSMPTFAQYQWKDANGSMVFSDRPPPPGTAVRIVKAPPAPPVAPLTPKPASGTAPAEKVAAATPTTDRSLTDKVKQAEKADKAKASAEQEQVAKDQVRQCDNLKENSRVLQSGERISRIGKSGEREFLSEAEKNARLQENTRDLAKYCK
jgi:Domain of unknown function (DUF4124)